MWRVVIHNDQVNSFAVVIYLMHTFCAMAVEEAAALAYEVHLRGSAVVAEFPAQGDAEQLVVAFQRRGLDASVRPA